MQNSKKPMEFANKVEKIADSSKAPYKIMVVDDEEEIHSITSFVLNGFTYMGRELRFLNAYSGEEAKKLIVEHPDTALILLDVIMEDDDSGLQVAKYIRDEVKNRFVRIVLRTGQPGYFPEKEIIAEFDINDYKEKTELTATKLFTLTYSSIRSYVALINENSAKKQLADINRNLEQIVLDKTAELKEQHNIMMQQSRRAAMAEMLGMIAHQWRQPLSTISAIAGNVSIALALDEFEQDSIADSMTKISDHAKKLSLTIDSFRSYFKPGAQKETVLVSTVIMDTLSLLQHVTDKDKIDISYIAEDSISLTIYRNELLQVFLNVVKNSQEELSRLNIENPKITILEEKEENNHKVTICDNAGGIDDDILPKVFEPYFSTKSKNGSGLGLYMCKTIIEDYLNGKIVCYNRGGGACFKILLPLK